MTFRPNNVYSKGVYADKVKGAGLLLKVKVKRRLNEVKTEKVEVLGYTDAVYQFDKLCDYEMSPILKKSPEATKAEMIYDEMIPSLNDTLPSFLEVLMSQSIRFIALTIPFYSRTPQLYHSSSHHKCLVAWTR